MASSGGNSSSVDKGNKASKRKQRPADIALPASFEPAPDNLAPFLGTLDKRRAYITHIDVHPGWFKRRVFAIPVLLNVAVAALLGWRLYAALPWYTSLARGMLERPGDFGEHLFGAAASWQAFAWIVLKRTALFALDYSLVMVVAPWPYGFFLERPGNPMRWRTAVRFRAQEVIVRVSRGWGAAELVGASKKGADSPFFKTKVAPAIGRDVWLKTGYLLMGAHWDLDFAAMVTAHELVDSDEFRLKDIDKKVFVFYPPPPDGAAATDEVDGRWLVYDVPRPAEEKAAEDYLKYQGSDEGKKKIIEMRQRLAAMGKEELFFKWVDLVQEEVRKPGGFTKERQLEAGLKVQALFEEYAVEWERFARDVGLPTEEASS